MIRTAITGSGMNFPYYLDIIRDVPDFLITGIVSYNKSFPEEMNPGIPCFELYQVETLVDISEALIVTYNAGKYYDLITKFLKRSRHVLILADTSLTFQQVKRLSKIAEEAGVSIHIHHNTSESSIIEKIKNFIIRPEYLYVKTYFNTEEGNTDKTIPEILSREIYTIFELNPYNIREINVKTIPFCSSEPDLLNLRIDFENGLSAQLIISSFNEGRNRLLEIYGPDRMISYNGCPHQLLLVDKLTKKVEKINLVNGNAHIHEKEIFIKFAKYIMKDLLPDNRFTSGIAAYQTAVSIISQIISSPVVN